MYRTGNREPISGRTLGLQLQRAPGAPPLYHQIRDGVRTAVVIGTLGAGTRLPPERELAAALGVNRTTVMHAYQELAADGVVEARPGRGTVICAAPQPRTEAGAWLLGLPAFGNGNIGPDPGLLRDIASLSARSDIISFAAGAPGPELLPLVELQKALTKGLERSGAGGLGYGPVEGLQSMRHAIAGRLANRGVRVGPDEVMVLSGATQGLALAAQALVEPGDDVVVEAPTYIGLLQTFAAAGARLIGVPVDEHGMRVELLGQLLARRSVRLIVVQPTLHNPTSATLAPERRERLLSLSRRYNVPILEDDAYGELWRDGSGPGPLKALDRSGLVMHLGTFSKTAAPGLRVGWLAAPVPVIGRFALAKQFADMHTNALAQLALCEFLESGGYDAHLQRVREAYAERRRSMLAALSAAPGLQVGAYSDGGFYLWCRLPAGKQARVVAAAAGRAGVALLAGEAFYPRSAVGVDDGLDRIRLSFSYHDPETIAEGVRRLLPLLEHDPDSVTGRAATRGLQPIV